MLSSTTLWGLFAQRAQTTPDAPLVIDGLTGTRLSCRQALQQAQGLAAALLSQGVEPGSRVTWQLPTALPAFLLQLALARLSVVQNPVISLYGRAEVRAVMARNRPDWYLVPEDGSAGLEGRAPGLLAELPGASPAPRLIVLPEVVPQGDPATLPPAPEAGDMVRWIYVTSGTTAEPKGARHTDEALLRAGSNLALASRAGPQDVGTIAFPIAHIGGAMNTVMLLASGASAVLLPRYQPAEAMEVFRRFGVTLTGGSTAHYQAMLTEQRRKPEQRLLPTLRVLSGGGAPKPPDLVAQVRDELGCVLTHAYGMTEAPLMAACQVDHSLDQLAYSDGAVVEGMELRIVRADETIAATGEDGEIRVRGPGIFKGYTDPELDAAAFDAQGWFKTGDLGRLRADGHVSLTGRIKDVIIRKGENISAREVEDVLARHPKVGAVAVIGLPDAERGERVCAVVEPKEGEEHLTFGEMVAWFQAAGLMRQKIPEQLEVMAALPRMSSLNKISKAELRKRFAAQSLKEQTIS